MPAAPQLRDSHDLEEVLTEIEKLDERPTLIVLDTFARCFVGGEENSAKEVGEWVEACLQQRWSPIFGQVVKVESRSDRRNLEYHERDGATRLS